MNRCTLSACLLALGASVIGLGCAARGGGMDRPAYLEPEAGGKGRATLRGVGGVYIQGVDGSRVDSANTRVRNIGGNNVIVSAGMRRVHITRSETFKSRNWDFDFLCEKGHTYEFAPDGGSGSRLKVTDKTIGESLTISDNDLSEAW